MRLIPRVRQGRSRKRAEPTASASSGNMPLRNRRRYRQRSWRSLAALLILTLVAAGNAHAQVPSRLEPLSFLLGEWEGAGSGSPGPGSGVATFSRGLQDRVIILTTYSQYPASQTNQAFRHDDLMIIYVEQGNLRADYYDNEGHIIRYAASAPAPGEALFVSDVVSGTPRYRLGYKLVDGKLTGRFEIAPPGKPDGFSKYLEWETRRKEQSR